MNTQQFDCFLDVISKYTAPPVALPAARSRLGTSVHPTKWALVRGSWVAYPVCHEKARLVAPGGWTHDAVTCVNCLKRDARLNLAPQPRVSHLIIRRRLLLWQEIVSAVGELAADANSICMSDLPSDRTRVLQMAEIYHELRGLIRQCRDLEALELARLYLPELRQALLDIVLESLGDRHAA